MTAFHRNASFTESADVSTTTDRTPAEALANLINSALSETVRRYQNRMAAIELRALSDQPLKDIEHGVR